MQFSVPFANKVKGTSTTIALVHPKWPDQDKKTKSFDKALIVPFWLVKETADPERGNMQQSTLKCTCSFSAVKGPVHNSIMVPVLQNRRTLHEGDELMVYNEELKRAKDCAIEPKRKDAPKCPPRQACKVTKR